MDTTTIATLTAALTFLAQEVARGGASEIGKATWKQIKGKFGWSNEPPVETLAPSIAEKLQVEPALIPVVIETLESRNLGTTTALIGSMQANSVIVSANINVQGDLNM